MIKAVLLDFDGTLVTRDILDVVCGIVGKEAESEQINREYHEGKRVGLEPLVTRINFLKGVSQGQIESKLRENSYLLPGAKELLSYLNAHNIISVLNSGNIAPVLRAYKEILGITYVVGAEPLMDGDIIQGITENQFSSANFKLDGVKRILDSLGILPNEIVAIGDSPADRQVFDFAGTSIAINPKGGVEKFVDYEIRGDLSQAISIIQSLG